MMTSMYHLIFDSNECDDVCTQEYLIHEIFLQSTGITFMGLSAEAAVIASNEEKKRDVRTLTMIDGGLSK
jgi:hypothetical protein